MNLSFTKAGACTRRALYGALVVLGSAQAVAQEQTQLQEVVVTAQRREANLQDVPIAVTAFSGEALQQRALGEITALSQLTPGVNLDA
jgi:outer membrane receptor protein involved in Fe transport